MSDLKSIFASVAGVESADVVPVPEAVELTAEQVATEIVDKELAQVEVALTANTAEIAQQNTAIDAVEEKLEDLQEQIGGMESQMSGATPFNAGLFAERYSRGAKIVAKFGAPVELHGNESFADASTANMNALAGLESMKETASKAVGAIKQFFINLYNTFITAGTNLFARFGGLKKKAANFKSRAGSETLKTGKVSVSVRAATYLDDKGSDNGAVGIILAAAGRDHAMTKENALAHVGSIVDALAKVGTKTVKGSEAGAETLEVSMNKVKVTIVKPTTEEGLGKAKLRVSGNGEKAETEVEALTKEAAVKLAGHVETEAGKISQAKLNANDLKKSRDKAIAEMEKKAEGDEVKTVKAYRNAHRDTMELTVEGLKFASDILAAQLDMVDAVLGGKAPKEEKKEEEKKED